MNGVDVVERESDVVDDNVEKDLLPSFVFGCILLPLRLLPVYNLFAQYILT